MAVISLSIWAERCQGTIKVEVNLRPTDSWPVCLGVRRPSGTCDQFFFLLEIFFRQLRVCYFVAPSLMRERVCHLLYNCFWALPKQLLLGRSPAELTTIFYCPICDFPNLECQVPVLISPRNRAASIWCSIYSLCAYRTENAAYNSSSYFCITWTHRKHPLSLVVC
jgi:hypothetical protein